MKNSIGFIAIGQGGGNIGQLLERIGYNVVYLNTSSEDLGTLKNVKHTYHIKNGEGCNKDRDKAKALTIEDFENILMYVEEKLTEEFIFVLFSSGGGTGSGASPMLIDLLIQNSQKRVGAVTILPATSELLKAHINSYECFRELEHIEGMCATFILDNNKGDKIAINRKFVDFFNALIEIPEHHDIRGNIDKAEIKELLGTRGAAVLIKMSKSTSTIAGLIKQIHSGIFAPLEADRVIKYIGLSAVIPLDMDALYKETGLPLDIYQGKNPTHTVCMLCGLTYPYNILDIVRKKIEANQDTILKNLGATKTSRLADNINFLADPQAGQASDIPKPEKQTREDIFAKYKRK